MRLLVTGGAGFIGSAYVRFVLGNTQASVINVDKLTYAGNLESLEASVARSRERYVFEQADICDQAAMRRIFESHRPDAVVHLAAESHVDRSIDGPGAFIETNVVGTYNLLNEARRYWVALPEVKQRSFRFHHVSTDEVYGSLGSSGYFTEESPYQPNSPYSASKASSDHLVRAWGETYGLPVLVTNCSNNYGPYHFPEKLIPLMIIKAMAGEPLPVYGKGDNVRDWLYVDDHVKALWLVLQKGRPGETYNVGGHNEKTNLEVVEAICNLLDEMLPTSRFKPHRQLISFVQDRPGHDKRYAIDPAKIMSELGWKPEETFTTGLRKTVAWYLANQDWWKRIQNGKYRGERLGV